MSIELKYSIDLEKASLYRLGKLKLQTNASNECYRFQSLTVIQYEKHISEHEYMQTQRFRTIVCGLLIWPSVVGFF